MKARVYLQHMMCLKYGLLSGDVVLPNAIVSIAIDESFYAKRTLMERFFQYVAYF